MITKEQALAGLDVVIQFLDQKMEEHDCVNKLLIEPVKEIDEVQKMISGGDYEALIQKGMEMMQMQADARNQNFDDHKIAVLRNTRMDLTNSYGYIKFNA